MEGGEGPPRHREEGAKGLGLWWAPKEGTAGVEHTFGVPKEAVVDVAVNDVAVVDVGG